MIVLLAIMLMLILVQNVEQIAIIVPLKVVCNVTLVI